jgi:flagellar hook-associated protein 3 FlgL
MLTVQVPGSNTATIGSRGLIVDATSGAHFFQHLIALRDSLNAGNTALVVQTDRANLAKDEENFLFHLGTNGAIQSRLETAASVADTRGNSIEILISNEADSDLAQTLVRLNEAQNAYKAALQSGASILSSSLMDYLR